MKNKKIISSLNKVLPNKTSKDDILNNILTSNKSSKINFKILTTVLSSILLFFVIYSYTNSNSNEPLPFRSINNQITYNGLCYQEKGIYTDSISNLEFIEESKEFIMGDKIYKLNNSIIFRNNDNYIEFIRCEGN